MLDVVTHVTHITHVAQVVLDVVTHVAHVTHVTRVTQVVLDVGCGTGILSLFAARAGARLVIAVDASAILHQARQIVERNGYQGKVVLLQSTMEQVYLPEGIDKVDVIISEWMGYGLLYESMLPSVLFARDRFLKPGGAVLPTACPLLLTASSHNHLAFWTDVYGFDMGNVADAARADASIEIIRPDAALSAATLFNTIDCTSCADRDLDFTSPFEIAISRSGELRSLVVHFDTIFDLSGAGGSRTEFSTSAAAPSTHWKQTALYLNKPRAVEAGSTLHGSISFRRQGAYKRAYDISVVYHLDGVQCDVQMWRMQ